MAPSIILANRPRTLTVRTLHPMSEPCPRCRSGTLFATPVMLQRERALLGPLLFACLLCAAEYTPDELAAARAG